MAVQYVRPASYCSWSEAEWRREWSLNLKFRWFSRVHIHSIVILFSLLFEPNRRRDEAHPSIRFVWTAVLYGEQRRGDWQTALFLMHGCLYYTASLTPPLYVYSRLNIISRVRAYYNFSPWLTLCSTEFFGKSHCKMVKSTHNNNEILTIQVGILIRW